MPGRGIGRRRLTHGEARELDEGELNSDVTAARRVQQVGVVAKVGVERVGIIGRAAQRIELEVGLTESADHAVFGGGTRIDGQRHTRTGGQVVAIAVALAGIAVPSRLVLHASAVERGVDAQITAELDAGVGARDVEESRTIQRADPHVFDRFGLYGKISRLCPSHGDETRRRAEDKALNHLHCLTSKLLLWQRLRIPWGDDPNGLAPLKTARSFRALSVRPTTSAGLERATWRDDPGPPAVAREYACENLIIKIVYLIIYLFGECCRLFATDPNGVILSRGSFPHGLAWPRDH